MFSFETVETIGRWVGKLERRIEKLETGEQEVFAEERKKNLNEAYHMPIPPWVRGIRRIRKGEEAFRLERMRKEAAAAREGGAAPLSEASLAAHKARTNDPARPECECCK